MMKLSPCRQHSKNIPSVVKKLEQHFDFKEQQRRRYNATEGGPQTSISITWVEWTVKISFTNKHDKKKVLTQVSLANLQLAFLKYSFAGCFAFSKLFNYINTFLSKSTF